MNSPKSLKAALLGLLTLLCFTAAEARSPVFSEYSFEQAKQQAQQEHKFLLLDFSASWCSPCKKMEANTWQDKVVQSWIKENAIAIQIDVDKQEKLSSQFHITGMPTIVIFKPDQTQKEFGRQDGYLDATEMMLWLKGAQSVKSEAELAKFLEKPPEVDIWSQMSKARQLQSAGKNSEALSEYLALWSSISNANDQLASTRISLIPSEIKRIVNNYPEGKPQIAERRDAAEKADNRFDWILLNGVLDDNQKTLAWFDKAKLDPTQQDSLRTYTTLLEPVLWSNMRWADSAKYLYPDPLKRVSEFYERAQDMKKPRPDTEFAKDFDPFPNMVLLLYGAYVGANRDEDAKKIADECLRLDDTQAMRDVLKNMEGSMVQARSAQKQPAK